MTSTALHNSERIQELRKAKKDLESENHKMKASLMAEKEKSLEQVARSEVNTWSFVDVHHLTGLFRP